MSKDTIKDFIHDNQDAIGDLGVIMSNVGSWSIDVWLGLFVSLASVVYILMKIRNEHIKRKKSKEERENEREKHDSEIQILKLQLEKERLELELSKEQLKNWVELTNKKDDPK